MTKLQLANLRAPPKEWNKVVDRYLKDGTMSSDDGAKLGKAQTWWIHEFDKANARINKTN